MNIIDIIERIKAEKKLANDKEVAKLLNLSVTNFSNRKKRGSLIPPIVNWGVNEDIDLNWLFTGKHKKLSNAENSIEASESHPKITKIVNLLKTMENADIDDVEKMLEERKRMKEMEYKLSKMEEILKQKNAYQP